MNVNTGRPMNATLHTVSSVRLHHARCALQAMGFGGSRGSVPAHIWHCPKMGPNIQASPGKQFCMLSTALREGPVALR